MSFKGSRLSHFSRRPSYYLDEVDGLSVNSLFAGGRNDNEASKDVVWQKVRHEILNSA